MENREEKRKGVGECKTAVDRGTGKVKRQDDDEELGLREGEMTEGKKQREETEEVVGKVEEEGSSEGKKPTAESRGTDAERASEQEEREHQEKQEEPDNHEDEENQDDQEMQGDEDE